MPNSAKRDANGRTISKVCGRCGEDLGPEHYNPPARCWDCEPLHKAEKEAEEARKTPAQRLQEAMDKYQKEYSHLVESQWELIGRLAQALEQADPGFEALRAELPEAVSPSRGPEAILENDGVIRGLMARLEIARAGT